MRHPRLTAAQCRRICETRKGNSDITLSQLAQRFGVDRSTISKVLRGTYKLQEN